MTVSRSVGTVISLAIGIVVGPPQSNVTTPPCVTALWSAAAVQLPASPLPTTVVGWEVSASATVAEQVLAGGGPASTSGGAPSIPYEASSDPDGPLSSPVAPPLLDEAPEEPEEEPEEEVDEVPEEAPDDEGRPPSGEPPGSFELDPHPPPTLAQPTAMKRSHWLRCM